MDLFPPWRYVDRNSCEAAARDPNSHISRAFYAVSGNEIVEILGPNLAVFDTAQGYVVGCRYMTYDRRDSELSVLHYRAPAWLRYGSTPLSFRRNESEANMFHADKFYPGTEAMKNHIASQLVGRHLEPDANRIGWRHASHNVTKVAKYGLLRSTMRSSEPLLYVTLADERRLADNFAVKYGPHLFFGSLGRLLATFEDPVIVLVGFRSAGPEFEQERGHHLDIITIAIGDAANVAGLKASGLPRIDPRDLGKYIPKKIGDTVSIQVGGRRVQAKVDVCLWENIPLADSKGRPMIDYRRIVHEIPRIFNFPSMLDDSKYQVTGHDWTCNLCEFPYLATCGWKCIGCKGGIGPNCLRILEEVTEEPAPVTLDAPETPTGRLLREAFDWRRAWHEGQARWLSRLRDFELKLMDTLSRRERKSKHRQLVLEKASSRGTSPQPHDEGVAAQVTPQGKTKRRRDSEPAPAPTVDLTQSDDEEATPPSKRHKSNQSGKAASKPPSSEAPIDDVEELNSDKEAKTSDAAPSFVPEPPAPAPAPSIREMKAAIAAAGLGVADLVEKSDVVERYRQALARRANAGAQPAPAPVEDLTGSDGEEATPSPKRRKRNPPSPTAFVYPRPDAPDAITLIYDDRRRLDDGGLLNDSLINFFLRYRMRSAEAPPLDAHVFSTFFFTKLSEVPPHASAEMYAKVKSWCRGVDLFAKDALFVPVNEHRHWSLAVVLRPGARARPGLNAASSEGPSTRVATRR